MPPNTCLSLSCINNMGSLTMTRNYRAFLLMALLALPFGAANAEGYFGMKYGKMDISFENFEDPTNFGFVFGSAKSGGGLEFEMTQTTSSDTVEITTVGIYGSVRSEGDGPYFKGRVGFLNENVESESEAGLSMGLGFGFRGSENGPAIEFEYTKIEQ